MTIQNFGKFQTANIKLIYTLKKAQELAKGSTNFLILGEKGTGRRLMAEFIHESSERGFAPLVRYARDRDISAATAVLVENLQFLNSEEQTELLAIMQSSCKNSLSQIKWYATASANFQELVDRGFVKREFASLFDMTLNIPKLSDRKEDIVNLAEQVLSTISWVTGRVVCLSQEAKNILLTYEWPENVNELETVVEAAALKSKTPFLHAQDFEIKKEIQWNFAEVTSLAEMERKLILQTLQITNNNKTQAAKSLGISIRTLRNKLSLYRMENAYEPAL